MQVQKLRQHEANASSVQVCKATSSNLNSISSSLNVNPYQNQVYPTSGHQPSHHYNHRLPHHTMPYAASVGELGKMVAFGGITVAQQLKLKKTILRNYSSGTHLNSDALVKSFEKHFIPRGNNVNHNNNNNNQVTNNNLSNRFDETLVPKTESSESEHSQAVIDQDGNIILRFGDGAPIKIECDSSDLRV